MDRRHPEWSDYRRAMWEYNRKAHYFELKQFRTFQRICSHKHTKYDRKNRNYWCRRVLHQDDCKAYIRMRIKCLLRYGI